MQDQPNRNILLRLFIEFFKIALFVVGGGYAIIVVADDVFGKKLKWLKEGELLENLPIFQMIPGLIAGNTAIYVGLKIAGRTGAAIALLAVALPSLIIISLVAYGYNQLPLNHPIVDSVFLGLRSSLTGVVLGAIITGWKKSVKGYYGYIAVTSAAILLTVFKVGTVPVLLSAMAAGILLEYLGYGAKAGDEQNAGIALKPLSAAKKATLLISSVIAATLLTILFGSLPWIFAKFGILCFGGGFVLVPIYMEEFVGEAAPLLQLKAEEFSNLMAITQITPGPVAVNAATFFGYKFANIPGAMVATASLLLPSYILLTAALTGLNTWKNNKTVKGLLRGVKPATSALMITAAISFAGMSIWTLNQDKLPTINPTAIALAVFATVAFLKKKLSVMAIIFISAIVGAIYGLC